MPKLKPYLHYKPSNTQWLGDIPQHWEVRRLKTCVQDVIQPSNGVSEGDLCLALEHVESWTGKYKETGPDESLDSQTKRFMPDDVLFGKLRPYLAKVARPNREGICVGEFLVLRADPNSMIPNYLEQLILSKPVIEAINSSTFGAKMPRTDYQFIGNMHIPLPPIPEQRAIANYLDHQTALTDSLIAKKQRMTELLAERRQSIITHTVTKGLDPQAHTHDNQTEPMIRLHHLITINSGTRIPFYPEDEHSAVSIGGEHIQKHGFSLGDKTRFVPLSFYLDQKSGHIQHGDTLVVKDGATIGKSMFVDHMPAEHMMVNEHVFVLRAVAIDPRYLSFLIQAKTTQDTIWSLNVAAAQPGLSKDFVKSVRIPVVDLKEQRAIANYLDRETSLMDALTEKLNRQIELLAERRQSIITHAVTGKIDIRDHNVPATPA